MEIDNETIRAMAENVKGDLRGAINDLQSLAEGNKKIAHDDLVKVGSRDPEPEKYAADDPKLGRPVNSITNRGKQENNFG